VNTAVVVRPSASRPSSTGSLAGAIVFAGNPIFLERVAGMTILERAVSSMSRASIGPIVVVVPPGAARLAIFRSLAARYRESVRIVAAGRPVGVEAGDALEPSRRVLVLREPVVLDVEAVLSLKSDPAATEAAPPDGAAALLLELDSSARLEDLARSDGAGLSRVPGAAAAGPVARGVLEPVRRRADVPAALAALRRSLTKPTDGFFAAWIDRPISTRLSIPLARLGVSPNALTLAGLLPAVAGAALLAMPGRLWPTVGAVSYWASTVIDGCDGEVARLTHRESPRGARLDLLCDNAALVALFLGILAHVFRERPGPVVPILAVAILVGMAGCMVTEYRAILRPRIDSTGGSAGRSELSPDRVRWYERLASRDFAYLLPFIAAFGALRWLVWATAVGVNVFWLFLWGWVLRPRRKVA